MQVVEDLPSLQKEKSAMTLRVDRHRALAGEQDMLFSVHQVEARRCSSKQSLAGAGSGLVEHLVARDGRP